MLAIEIALGIVIAFLVINFFPIIIGILVFLLVASIVCFLLYSLSLGINEELTKFFHWILKIKDKK